MERVIFWIIAPFCLGSAIAMLLARNTVHSALLLVLNFFTLAVFFAVLDAPFLAVVQVIVYAGAIMVLFLFAIMLLRVDPEEALSEKIPLQRPIAVLLGLGLAAVIVFTVRTALSSTTFKGLTAANQGGNVQAVGRLLYNKYLFAFELTSVLLIVAAVGAILLGRRPEDDPEQDGDADALAGGAEPPPQSVAPEGSGVYAGAAGTHGEGDR